MASPLRDLAGITLEVNRLPQALAYYQELFGLDVLSRDDDDGRVTLRVGTVQWLTLWEPRTRRPFSPRLAPLRPRGASHLHYAWQILPDDLERCRRILSGRGVEWQEIDLGTPDQPDPGLYFHDPFGHGLELRTVRPEDDRASAYPPRPRAAGEAGLPVMGLREVALAFGDYPAMLERLPRAYGFVLAKEQDDRNFAQFTLGPEAQPDGTGTPRRWLYAWDPQVGLADMFGGDHALVEFYADVEAVAVRVRHAGLEHLQDGDGLAVRDPEGHVFVFRERPDGSGPE